MRTDLAGNPLATYPYFEYVRAIHEGAPAWFAIDPRRFRDVFGKTADVYVVLEKSDPAWWADKSLIDVRGAPQTVTFSAATIQGSTFQIDAGTLSGDAGDGLGVGYDVVIDVDRNARLSIGDVIDGLGPAAGFYVVRDTVASGPHAVVEIQYSGGSFLGQDTYYPSDIAQLGELPLVVVSHGNGHDYRWYDHIGYHLASWGCIVMSHQNNTGPGPAAASTTTLTNTDYIISNQATIGGGALAGHIDSHRIVFIGHSRGGEGVVRAYNRVLTGNYLPQNFGAGDIRLVSSIAPTSFLVSDQTDPELVNFHLFVGASDSDVTGAPDSVIAQNFCYFERATGNKHAMSIQGAGHADFHAGGGSCWCTGPNLIGAAATHTVEQGYYLPLVKLYTQDNIPARDFFTRMYDTFRPPGIPSNVIVAKDYRDSTLAGNLVLDDFQVNPDIGTSSSGTAVFANLASLEEGRMSDVDGSFAFSGAVPMNGMTRARDGGDQPSAAVFDWTSPGFYGIFLPPSIQDLHPYGFLAFRACQGTRHPNTDTLDAPLAFSVSLVDGWGRTSTIGIANYGALTRTYERGGYGAGFGWGNEFCSVRLRLTDFLNNDSQLDLRHVQQVRFDFGAGFGSPLGRVAIDDIEIVGKGL